MSGAVQDTDTAAVPSQPLGSLSTREELRRGQKQVVLQEEQYLSPGRSPDRAEGLGMLRSTQRPLPLSAPAGHPAPGHGAPQTNMDSGERKAPVNSY